MSSLIFRTDQDQAFVATDTLAVSPDGRPFMFTTKALVVPHLRMIMCGTGVGGFLGKWFVKVNDRMVVRGIDNLDNHAPKRLETLWANHVEDFPEVSGLTATIYHFGFSEEEDVIHSYAYRSTGSFRSEYLSHGTGVKPECSIPPNHTFPTDLRSMMDEQIRIQSTLPVETRVYIGGEIQVHHITRQGIAIYTWDRFDDYETVDQAIFSNFASHKSE